MEAFKDDIFPYPGTRPEGGIKPLDLLNVLRKIEKLGALEKRRKVWQRCPKVFRYAIATGRAEYNPAADLSSALEVHQSNHFPFLKAYEIPGFLRALEGYTGRACPDSHEIIDDYRRENHRITCGIMARI